MKKETEYQTAKKTLKWVSLDAKSEYRGDSPAIRMIINDTCDAICKDLRLSDYHHRLLDNYSCKLHPKD
jgi:hypothetical protein